MPDNTSGGTTTSLNNTVQAKDDYFYGDEDEILCFDVMANDLGGNAKILWSIDTSSDDGSQDLVAKDVAGVGEYSELGAKITLTTDGKIKYDSSFSSAINALADGEVAYDTFTYAIRLSNGTLSWATVTVQITGTNDGPNIFVGSGDDSGETFNETNAPLSTTGTLSVVDPDTTDTVDTTVSGVVLSGDTGALVAADVIGMLTITAGANDLAANTGDANNLGWAFNSNPEAFNFLAVGESLTLTYTLTSTDGTASDTQDVVIVINGTNDGPDIFVGSGDDSGETFNETNAPLSTSGTLSVVDPDTSDVVDTSASLVVSGNQGSLLDADLLAMFSITAGANDLAANVGNANNLSWSFNSNPEAFNYLAVGESLTLTYTLTSTDGNGGSDTQNVVITINGTNDGPVANADTGSAGENENKSFDVVANDTDVDSGAVLSLASIDGVTVDGLAASAAEAAAFTIAAGDVQFTPGTAFDHLAAGDSATVVVSYTVEDEHGATASSTLTLTVNGVNDAALITGDADGEVTEDAVPNTTSGTLIVSDVDDGQNELQPIAAGTAGDNGYGTFQVNANGQWTYTLNNGNAAVQALNAGAFLTDTITVTSEDGTDTQVITVTIWGANDGVTLPSTFNGLDAVNDHDNDLGVPSGGSPLLPGATEGDDTLDGRLDQSGADTINALGGNDTVNAGMGGDNVYGGSGSDTIFGGTGNDVIYGQGGNDFLYGQDNNDQLYGGSGDDFLDGGNNTDTLLNGGSGNDTIIGGIGADIIIGGYGADILTGNVDDDIFRYLSKLDTNDTITDFRAVGAGNDQIDLSGIDANELLALDQDFAWGGDDGPIANGVWFTYDLGTNTTTLLGDTDGNLATAEFMLTLSNFSGFNAYADPLTPPPTAMLDG